MANYGIIKTKDLILKPIEVNDYKELHKNFYTDEFSASMMLWEPSKNLADSKLKVQKELKRVKNGNFYSYVMIQKLEYVDRYIDEDNEDIFKRPIKTVFTKNLRREKLVGYLKYLNGRKVLVRDLAWKFAVTERTIQNDLNYLIEKGVIERKVNFNKNGKQQKNSYILNSLRKEDLPHEDNFLNVVFLVKDNEEYYILTKTDYIPKRSKQTIDYYDFTLPEKKINIEERLDTLSLQIAKNIFKKEMDGFYKGHIFTKVASLKFESYDNYGRDINEYYKTKFLFSLFILDEKIEMNGYHWLKLTIAPRRIRNRVVSKCIKYIKEHVIG